MQFDFFNVLAMCSRENEDDCFSVGRPNKNRREVMFPTVAPIAYEPLLWAAFFIPLV